MSFISALIGFLLLSHDTVHMLAQSACCLLSALACQQRFSASKSRFSVMVRILRMDSASAAGGLSSKDARLRIMSKNKKGGNSVTDARQRLNKTTSLPGGDARNKLNKIGKHRNTNTNVKTTARGSITIRQTASGGMVLTTKNKGTALTGGHGAIVRQVGRGGGIQLSTRHRGVSAKLQSAKPGSVLAAVRSAVASVSGVEVRRPRPFAASVSRSEVRRPRPFAASVSRSEVRRPIAAARRPDVVRSSPVHPLTRTIRGELSEAARLDQELMTTHVDPLILKRTVRQNVQNVPSRTMARPDVFARESRDLFTDSRVDTGISPLQGAKIVVSNLEVSVSLDDIMELLSDIGPLKRGRTIAQGTVEVVFVNRADAAKAIEVYHNRQLDGKTMKCQMATPGPSVPSVSRTLPGVSAAASSSSRRSQDVEISAVHRALFNTSSGSSRPMFAGDSMDIN